MSLIKMIITSTKNTWKIAQSVKCLLPKHEGLISNPQHLCKNWAQKHRAIIPGLGVAEIRGSLQFVG